MKVPATIFILIMLALRLHASDYYWTNSPPASAQYVAGDTVHLVGTFTNAFTVTNSGTAGNPITFYFEPNAKFSAPTLPNNQSWITLNGNNFITIDGGSSGVIELTDNGTVAANGGTKTFGNSGIKAINGINGLGSIHNITVQNLMIRGMYVRQTNTEPIQGSGDSSGITLTGSSFSISNCFVSDCQDGIFLIYGSAVTSNLTVTTCTITNYNHGITVGAGAVTSPLFNNLTITHNTFQGGDMYETYDGGELGLHRNPIFIFNESSDQGGCVSNIIIAYNFIKHGVNPNSHTAGTGAMFFDIYNNQMMKRVRVFNNISTLAAPLAWSGGGGFIAGSGNDVLVANNTAIAWQTNGVVGGTGEISGNGTNVYLYNNICVSKSGISLSTYVATNGLTPDAATVVGLMAGVWSDFNIYNYQGNNSFYEVVFSNGGSTWQATLLDTLGQWTNIFSGALHGHFDPHSLTNAVQLNSSFQPLSTDTVAIGNGTNLTAWGITDDYAGNPRPATGNWTIGAYEYVNQAGGNSGRTIRGNFRFY